MVRWLIIVAGTLTLGALLNSIINFVDLDTTKETMGSSRLHIVLLSIAFGSLFACLSLHLLNWVRLIYTDSISIRIILSGTAKELFERMREDTDLSVEDLMFDCIAVTNVAIETTKKGKNLYPLPAIGQNDNEFISTEGLENVRNKFKAPQ